MQHEGAFETLLHAQYARQNITVRNLAFSADELVMRLRSAGFGSPDEWLAANKTDTVLAYFGFNESFGGEAQLPAFRKDLEAFVDHTLSQKYNGSTAPQLVLFSPIAAEDLGDPNLPGASELNVQIRRYVDAMREVAAKKSVPFVDLFAASQKIYDNSPAALTINGIHLNDEGNRLLAAAIAGETLGQTGPTDWSALGPLQAAVTDKNFYWFNRYRTTDGYSIYGGRSYLKFVGGQDNRVVMQREMEVLDVMTANRDKAIWKIAASAGQVKSVTVDDSNTPPFIPVETNLPGDARNNLHVFLGGEEAIEKMTVAEGLEVNLFASEEQFPELVNPVQMAWDTRGRLWVCAWQSYPHWKPKDPMDDKLLILEDTNGDGKADVCKTFAGGLHNPTGFEFWNGGVLVAMAPDLLFLKDTDGDDQYDSLERVLHGLDSADTHHTANSFALDGGGGLYFQEGVFHRTQVETPYGPQHNYDACVWRFEPRTRKLLRYAAYGFANPHGHVFDAWGQDIIHDGTGANPYQGGLISSYLPFPDKHPRAPQVYNQRTRPCSGSEMLYSRHFPAEYQGDLLVGNVIGFLGILRYDLKETGAGMTGVEATPLLSSTDPNFRPVDFEIGPDGALYFTDWANAIIGHMQHNIRDPNRDKVHGRVYRVTARGRDLLNGPAIAGAPIPVLLKLLSTPELRVRSRVKIELSGRDSGDVLEAVRGWVATLDKNDAKTAPLLLEALWIQQDHNAVEPELLQAVLTSPESRARAAGVRVLSYWVDRMPQALNWLRRLAADDNALVRLEAVRASTYLSMPEAIEVTLISESQASDDYLEFMQTEAHKRLDPLWKNARDNGQEVAVVTDIGRRFFLKQSSVEDLLKKPRTPDVSRELLTRDGVTEQVRLEALAALAQSEQQTEANLLLATIVRLNSQETPPSASVTTDLVRLLASRPAAELVTARKDVERLALNAPQPVTRQVAFAALIDIDNNVEPAWNAARESGRALRDLLLAVPLISDPALRASLYPNVVQVLTNPEFTAAGGQGTLGRYVRIELPRKGTLTLAEVEVLSEGQNVARGGKAMQHSVSANGQPGRALDGNTSGAYSADGQTHTSENVENPWWEVDLGGEYPIESVKIFNRTDGDLGTRLEGFTLTILDARREPVFNIEKQKAPRPSITLTIEGEGAAAMVRRAAMNALVTLRGHETEAFALLARLMQAPRERASAVAALLRIPRQYWPKDQAAALVNVLLTEIRKTPAKQRTTADALATIEFADSLAALLPVDQGRQVRLELRELGVRVVRVGTLPERMAYDKEVLAAAAGKPIEFFFENPDLMPHNFVILQPGSLEEVGLLAEATAQSPDAAARQYVPRSKNILLASNLLQSRQTQRLSFTAPREPGVYPYVCTYPGHWRRMYGALYVVEDLDDYLANPEGYLASHELPVRDDLLKDRRPRTEWTFDDLNALVADQTGGRDFARGRQMFALANCVACHKMNGVGQEIGPDLTKIKPEHFAPVEVLRSLVDPSARIDEKYQTWVIVTEQGQVVTGMILKETSDEVQIIENPIAKAAPVVLKPSQIEERQKSPVSIMPKGLLDKLDREEILDLVAYITARGNEKDPVFSKTLHNHEHGAQLPARDAQAVSRKTEPAHAGHGAMPGHAGHGAGAKPMAP